MDELMMLSGFRHWLESNHSRFLRNGVRADILGQTPYVPSSIDATLKAERYEATVQLWEDGQSEFYFLDWEAADRDPEYQVEVTHYDFETADQLLSALETLVNRLSPILVPA